MFLDYENNITLVYYIRYIRKLFPFPVEKSTSVIKSYLRHLGLNGFRDDAKSVNLIVLSMCNILTQLLSDIYIILLLIALCLYNTGMEPQSPRF